jgi:hypothetical protein
MMMDSFIWVSGLMTRAGPLSVIFAAAPALRAEVPRNKSPAQKECDSLSFRQRAGFRLLAIHNDNHFKVFSGCPPRDSSVWRNTAALWRVGMITLHFTGCEELSIEIQFAPAALEVSSRRMPQFPAQS